MVVPRRALPSLQPSIAPLAHPAGTRQPASAGRAIDAHACPLTRNGTITTPTGTSTSSNGLCTRTACPVTTVCIGVVTRQCSSGQGHIHQPR